MHHAPLLDYNGLTILLDGPSRFDRDKLLSGYAGQAFEGFLMPVNRFACDIRDISYSSPFLPDTRVVLLLGQKSLSIYKPDFTLNEQRGSPFVINEIVYIASYFPQDAFDRQNYDPEGEEESEAETFTEKGHQKTRRKNWRFWLYNDTKKAVRILREGLKTHRDFPIYIFPSITEVEKSLRETKNSTIFVDIETDKQFNLTCIGIGFSDRIYTVPIKRFNNTLAYDPFLIQKFFQALAIAFRDNTVVAHNAIFDFFVLAYRYKIPFPRGIFDNMLGWHRCYPELEKSLGHLISFLTDLPYHKSEGIFDPQNIHQERQLWEYNSKDIRTTIICHHELIKEIKRLGCESSAIQACESVRPYLTMMYKGIKMNVMEYLQKFLWCEKRKEQLQRCLNILVGRSLNPRSSNQVSEYLFTELKLPEPTEDPTNEKNLLKLLTKKEIPSIRLILEIRGISKLASSLKFRLWNNNFDSNEYERLTCVYNIGGTDTFRLSSKALLRFKPDKGFGTNVQNWDKKKRYLCIPDDGKILGQTDQAGAEALIVAYLCRKGRLRDLFINKIKSHVYVALHIYKEFWAKQLGLPNLDEYVNSPVDKLKDLKYWNQLSSLIKNDSIRYYIGKKTCHSANYDIGPFTFQFSILKDTNGALALSFRECREFLTFYKTIFPEIPQWHLETQQALKQTRTLKNLFGYPRKFFQPFGEELWKAGYAFIPQSTVGSITNIAITRLQQRLDKHDPTLEGLDLLQNGHDSILWQCPIGRERDIASIIKIELEQTFKTHRGEVFTMGSETSIGMNWGPKSDENSEGMEEIKL